MSPEEMDVKYYFEVIQRRWKLFFLIFLLVLITGVVGIKLSPKKYQSTNVILPAGKKSSSGGALGMLKAQFEGMPMMGGLGSSEDKSIQIYLESISFAEFFVKNLNLIPWLVPEVWNKEKNDWLIPISQRDDAFLAGVNALRGSIKVTTSDSGTILVNLIWTDKETAYYLASHVLEQLNSFMGTSVYTDARKNRIFLEKQLEVNQRELLEVGKKISQYYGNDAISPTYSKIDVDVSIKYEDEMKHFVGTNVSEAEIKKMIENLNRTQAELDQRLQSIQIVKDVPHSIYLEYLTMKRGILTSINLMLNQQYQFSKIQEIKEENFFTIVDKAQKPRSHFKPNAKLGLIISFVLGLFIAVTVVYISEFIANLKTRGSITSNL